MYFYSKIISFNLSSDIFKSLPKIDHMNYEYLPSERTKSWEIKSSQPNI